MSTGLSATAIHGGGVWKLWWMGSDASNSAPTCIGVFASNEDAHFFRRACLESEKYADAQFVITRGYVTGMRFIEEVPKP